MAPLSVDNRPREYAPHRLCHAERPVRMTPRRNGKKRQIAIVALIRPVEGIDRLDQGTAWR
jgi:hypothetical protein